MAALIQPIVAVNAQSIALESQGKAERLNHAGHHLLTNQMMDEEGFKPVLVRIVASDHSLAVDVLKVAFNDYAANIKSELELPIPKTNILKLLTD
ncbi:MAG: hypothetical protein V4808_00815 [Pseudomonadota bacterium]